jgi:3-oxoacyl-[acyl-carrier protein] reductase
VTPSWLSLDGKRAVITGAGSENGIGFSCARSLLELGAEVAIMATGDHIHQRVRDLSGYGIVHGYVCDLTDERETLKTFHAAADECGGLDILINNAGMASVHAPVGVESGPLGAINLVDFNRAMSRNLMTVVHATRAALPFMQAAEWGRIITIASVTGPLMAMRGESAYAAAKAAIVGLTRSLAVDYASEGITANALAPGWIHTGSQTEHEYREGQLTPMGRSATPSEVAAVAAFLATPGASYLTGQCIAIDGGNTVAEESSLA